MLYKIRQKLRKFESFIGRVFSFLNPNHVTLFSLITSIAVFYFILQSNFIIASLLVLFTGFLDYIDGAVARYTSVASPKGAYLDTIVDRYSELIMVAGLFFVDLPKIIILSSTWVMLYVFGSLLTSYAKAAASEKMSISISTGFIERPERILLMFVTILLGNFNTTYMLYLIIIMAILTNITAIQRIITALRK